MMAELKSKGDLYQFIAELRLRRPLGVGPTNEAAQSSARPEMNSGGTESVSQTWLGVKKNTCPARRIACAATLKTTG